MPTVKIFTPDAAACFAAATASALNSSPSDITTMARENPSALPKASSAVRMASAMFDPPFGITVVSSSSRAVSTAP